MEEKDILSLITDSENQDLGKAIEILREDEKNRSQINDYYKEVYDLDRKLRPTQVDKLIQDKYIGEGDNRKFVQKVRVKIPFPKKIIRTATAFEFGKPVNITYDEETELNDIVLDQWKSLRMDSKLQELTIHKKTETESCIVFYLTNKTERSERKLKSKVYSSKDGKMIPYFNDDEDMVFFTWCFETESDNKKISHYWVYDNENIYQIIDSGAGYELKDIVEHGFDKIPVVYASQDQVEYFDVKEMIDRYEVALSKLGNSNDYTGHPLLFLEGEVEGLPDKDQDGKVLMGSVKIDPKTEKEVRSNAKFLTHDNAPEAVKLELEQLKEHIYSMTSTPDVSFSNLKGIGNIASHSMELMFLDAKMKALLNEGDNRTLVERCLNVIISGIVTTMQTGLSTQRDLAVFDIEFESILPSSLLDKVTALSTAKQSGLISTDTAVKEMNLVNDFQEEVNLINNSQNTGNQE